MDQFRRTSSAATASRRAAVKLLAGGVAVAAAAGLPGRRTAAQTAPAMDQDVAFYRLRVGDFAVTVLLDGTLVFPAAPFGANVTPEEVAALLGRYNLPMETVQLPLANVVVETGRERILVDTGLGGYTYPGTDRNTGKLVRTMVLAGIDPASIDTVFLTHGHPDHIGGLIDPAGNPTFRNARYLLHQTEWDFWTGAPPAEDPFTLFLFDVAAAQLAPLAERVERFRDEIEVGPGIRTVAAAGHTLGHTGLLIESGPDRLLHMVDAAPHQKVAFEHPDWALAFELDQDLARETRLRLFDVAATERLKVFNVHHPFPGLGWIARDSVADQWLWTPDG